MSFRGGARLWVRMGTGARGTWGYAHEFPVPHCPSLSLGTGRPRQYRRGSGTDREQGDVPRVAGWSGRDFLGARQGSLVQLGKPRLREEAFALHLAPTISPFHRLLLPGRAEGPPAGAGASGSRAPECRPPLRGDMSPSSTVRDSDPLSEGAGTHGLQTQGSFPLLRTPGRLEFEVSVLPPAGLQEFCRLLVCFSASCCDDF